MNRAYPPSYRISVFRNCGACACRRCHVLSRAGAFTLAEMLLTLGLLMVLAWWVVPNFQDPLFQTHLPESAERMRTLIDLTRSNAMLDGLRYRIRFLQEDDEAAEEMTLKERLQPLVEIERDPIEYPGEFTPVKASWAREATFLGNVWCFDTRYGEPTYESVMAELVEQEEDSYEQQLKAGMGLEEEQSWALVFEPDGSSDWLIFRLVNTPYEEFEEDALQEYHVIDVIVDGRLGSVFLQRPLMQEEIEVLFEKGHSPILRRDFLTSRLLTEDDVLEINMGPRR